MADYGVIVNIVEWRDHLLESSLNYKAKFIGLILSQFYRRGNLTYPSIRTLSKLSGLTINPIQEGIQILVDSKFIDRRKQRMSGDRYLSNVYTFLGVVEIEHVSPPDVSRGDMSGGDTSNDTSNDTSPRDTKVEEEVKVGERTLKKFEDLELNEEYKKACNPDLIGKAQTNSWKKWKINYAPLGPGEDWLKSWAKWSYNEKCLHIQARAESDGEKPLEGDELYAQQLGKIVWLRERRMFILPQQEKELEEWQLRTGRKVTWRNNREWKEQGRPDLYANHS